MKTGAKCVKPKPIYLKYIAKSEKETCNLPPTNNGNVQLSEQVYPRFLYVSCVIYFAKQRTAAIKTAVLLQTESEQSESNSP